jgi:hypothetical protein
LDASLQAKHDVTFGAPVTDQIAARVFTQAPHFDLGPVTDSIEQLLARYQRFLDCVNNVFEPEAESLQIHPCLVCANGLNRLPQPS